MNIYTLLVLLLIGLIAGVFGESRICHTKMRDNLLSRDTVLVEYEGKFEVVNNCHSTGPIRDVIVKPAIRY